MMRRKAQVRQRDDKDFLGASWRHVTADPTLVAGVENARNRAGTIDADLQSSSSQNSDDLLCRKRRHRKLVLQLLKQRGDRCRVVDHAYTSFAFAVAACQHTRTHSRSVSERTKSGTAPPTTPCGGVPTRVAHIDAGLFGVAVIDEHGLLAGLVLKEAHDMTGAAAHGGGGQ